MSVKTKLEFTMNGTPLGQGYSISKSHLMLTTYSESHFNNRKQSWPLD